MVGVYIGLLLEKRSPFDEVVEDKLKTVFRSLFQAQTAARSVKGHEQKEQLPAASSYQVLHESPGQDRHLPAKASTDEKGGISLR